MPNIPSFTTWLADDAHSGRTLFVDLVGDDQLSALAGPYAGHLVRATSDGAALSALMVRPDGLVACPSVDGESYSAALQSALSRRLGRVTSTVPE
jgi:hypothetical protein